MARKALGRFGGRDRHQDRDEIDAWLKAHAENSREFAAQVSEDLSLESDDFAAKAEAIWSRNLKTVEVQLGGGADHWLLYFLTRLLEPSVIVETGVAAGYSSFAFLTALRDNRHGQLYSSDFPYFRLRDPESYIGVLVDDELRSDWVLDIRGDRTALPRFAEIVEEVGFFHYDSDKTVAGRQFALDALSSVLTEDSVLMFDDIGDNDHFRTLVETRDCHFHVFDVGSKFAGLIENFCAEAH